MTTLPDTAVPKLPHGVRFRHDQARDRHVLVGPERIFNADGPAREILQRVDGKTDIAGIVDQLTEIFAADAATIRPDVDAFLSDLADKQMVEL